MKKYMKYYTVIFIVGVFLLCVSGGYYFYRVKCQELGKYACMKKSIAQLHYDYVKDPRDIKIIDEFNYENNKVLLFSYNELSGYANFIKCTDSEFVIKFVETFDKNNKRQFSKAT